MKPKTKSKPKAKPGKPRPATATDNRKQPGKAAPISPALRDKIYADLREQILGVEEIAKKYSLSPATIEKFYYIVRKADLAAKLESDWPGDSAGQLKRLLSHVCKTGAAAPASQFKDICASAKSIAEIVLVFDGKASSIVQTESKSSGVDLSKLSNAQIDFLMGIEGALAGESVKETPLCYDPKRPMIYNPAEPDGLDKTPLENTG